MRYIFTAILMLWTANLCAQHVELRFDDDSNIKAKLLDDSIELQTKYGKLIIPIRDVRKIDFGLLVPEDLEIEKAVRSLSSPIMAERHRGELALLKAKHYALPLLRLAQKSKDAEVSKRAKRIIDSIIETTDPGLCNLSFNSTVHTDEFLAVGLLLNKKLKITSAFFGETTLNLNELRYLTSRQNSVLHHKLDASNKDWVDVGYFVGKNNRLIILANGTIDLWPQNLGQYTCTPKGYNIFGKGGTHLAGALIGRIGENGRIFQVNESYDEIQTESGKLFLKIVGSPWDCNNQGEYSIIVRDGYR